METNLGSNHAFTISQFSTFPFDFASSNLIFKALLNRSQRVPGLEPSDLVSKSLGLLASGYGLFLLVCAKKVHWEPKSIADVTLLNFDDDLRLMSADKPLFELEAEERRDPKLDRCSLSSGPRISSRRRCGNSVRCYSPSLVFSATLLRNRSNQDRRRGSRFGGKFK